MSPATLSLNQISAKLALRCLDISPTFLLKSIWIRLFFSKMAKAYSITFDIL